jgi:hypothetical protein
MDQSSVVSFIIRLINEAHPSPIAGGQLSARVKAFFPEFYPSQFSCRNLREFIRNHVPEVVEVGRAGMDVIYGPRAQQGELFTAPTTESRPAADRSGPLGQLLTNPRIWKTFTSPETPYRLYLVSPGLVRVLRPEETPDTSWERIPPVSADALLRIAKDFISELPGSQQELLIRTLDQPRWWFPYFDLLGTLGLKMRWVFYRRRRITEEFERALAAVSPRLQAPEATQTPAGPRPVSRETEAQHSLRHIAASAIQRMTDSELRALNLPLGYVLDALGNK